MTTIYVKDLDTAVSILKKIRGNAVSSAMLNELGQTLVKQTKDRIIREKSDKHGRSWKRWSPNYAKTRQSMHSLLRDKGARINDSDALLNHISYNLRGKSTVMWGSDLVYGRVHQLGGRNTPKRPFLGVSDKNARDISEVVVRHLEELVERLAK